MNVIRSLTRLAAGALLLALPAACQSTPLDNVWPGCQVCTPRPRCRTAPPPLPSTTYAETYAEPTETYVSESTPTRPASGVPVEVRIDETISPVVDCNPIKTQHTLVVTVLDEMGNPMPGQRVEWMLSRFGDAVGDIVAHDDQYGTGAIAPVPGARPTNAGNKITNSLAVSVTNYGPELIDAGNNYPYTNSDGSRLPDFTVGRGQSWVTITATREGVTDLVAFVPAIRDGTKHKIFAKKIWADFDVQFPENAVNMLPEDTHRFPLRVRRSDDTGIPGQEVEAEILDGPGAVFEGAGGKSARLTTDAEGHAELVIRNVSGEAGTNRIKLTAHGSFYGESCPRTQIVEKVWQRVALEIDCQMPETTPMGRAFEKTITVRNTGDADAEDVVLDDTPGGGLSLEDAGAFPMEIGVIPAGESITRTVRLIANTAGTLTNNVSLRSARASAHSTCSIEVVQGQLEITKVCDPASAPAGSKINFIVTVSNTGQGPLENVQVVDEYPAGIQPASQNTTTLGTVLPGEAQEIVFTGIAQEAGTYRNTARATADGVEEATAQCTVEVVQCKLELEMTGPKQIWFGEEANFTLHVQNVGDGNAEGCSVRVNYGGCLGGGFEDFAVGPLAPGQTWEHSWLRKAVSVGPCTIEAESNCGQSCSMRRNAEVRVAGLTALQLEMIDKAADGTEDGVFDVGETFLYVLRIENDGGTAQTPEMFIEWLLPPELEFIMGRSIAGDVEVTGADQRGRSGAFVLPVGGAIDFEIQVRALQAPRSTLTMATATVRRQSDNEELAKDIESSTIKPARTDR